MSRLRLLGLLLAVAAAAVALLPGASADQVGSCLASVQGRDLESVSATDPRSAVAVEPGGSLGYAFLAPAGVTRFALSVHYGPYTVPVAQQAFSGRERTLNGNFSLQQVPWMGTGLYRVSATTDLVDGGQCGGTFLVRIEGDPLAHPVGIAAAAGLLVGAGALLSSMSTAAGAAAAAVGSVVAVAAKVVKAGKDGPQGDGEKGGADACFLLHGFEQEPETAATQAWILRDGAFVAPDGPGADAVAAKRRTVGPGWVSLELQGGSSQVEHSLDLGKEPVELRRSLRLAGGVGSCSHPFQADSGILVAGGVRAVGLKGSLEVWVDGDLVLEAVVDDDPASALADPLSASLHLGPRRALLESKGGDATVSLPTLLGLDGSAGSRPELSDPVRDALDGLLGNLALPGAALWRRESGRGRFRDRADVRLRIRGLCLAYRLTGKAERVAAGLLVAQVPGTLEDGECPELKPYVKRAAEATATVAEFSGRLRSAGQQIGIVARVLSSWGTIAVAGAGAAAVASGLVEASVTIDALVAKALGVLCAVTALAGFLTRLRVRRQAGRSARPAADAAD